MEICSDFWDKDIQLHPKIKTKNFIVFSSFLSPIWTPCGSILSAPVPLSTFSFLKLQSLLTGFLSPSIALFLTPYPGIQCCHQYSLSLAFYPYHVPAQIYDEPHVAKPHPPSITSLPHIPQKLCHLPRIPSPPLKSFSFLLQFKCQALLILFGQGNFWLSHSSLFTRSPYAF